MDYFLADPVVVPQEERSLYAEEVVDLPCFLCYEPPGYLPEVSPLPALGGRPFTFGCINRIEKITDRVIALWGRIFAALPEAQLVLKDGTCDDAAVRQQLLARLGAAGIAAERVRILGHSQHAEHLRIYQEIDAGLDPFPQNGGISTAEALAMGVPVVSLFGTTISSRITCSMLAVLGTPEWVARTESEYVRIAVQAARNLPGLAHTRAELRTRLTDSPLGDVKQYTRSVEATFRSMWQRWCDVNLPEGQWID
jgi:predicted O-linked N-acetylglucosamine transferase (SPINDLY family)